MTGNTINQIRSNDVSKVQWLGSNESASKSWIDQAIDWFSGNSDNIIHEASQPSAQLWADLTATYKRWEKKILGIIRRLFPNMQIILTTHSPFVVSSLDGARIYTCVPQTGYSEVRDETDKYGHMPVEEILQSDVFSVNPFNEEKS